jgi:hypothetical protein
MKIFEKSVLPDFSPVAAARVRGETSGFYSGLKQPTHHP